MKNESELKEQASEIIKKAKSKKASDVQVKISINEGFNINIRQKRVEIIEFNLDQFISIEIYKEQKRSLVATSDLSSKEKLEKIITKGCVLADLSEDDKFCGLAPPELMFKDENYNLDISHPDKIAVQEAIDFCLENERAAFLLDKRINNCEGVAFSAQKRRTILANSHGFCGTRSNTDYTFSCSLIASDGKNMEMDYAYTNKTDYFDLPPFCDVVSQSVKNCTAKLNSRRLKTQKLPVILLPRAAKTILSLFGEAISGYNLYKQNSFLVNCLNREIFARKISIYEDPLRQKGLRSRLFDDDGIKTEPKNFIREGILEQFALDTYSARRLDMKTTANSGGIFNLAIESKETPLDLEKMIKSMNRGLIISDFLGDGVNLVTGDFSKGAVGFYVEGGEICYPVAEITISGNLVDLFRTIEKIGNDIDDNSSIISPSILISEMMIGGD